MGTPQLFINKKDPNKRNFEATAVVGQKRVGKSSLVRLLIDKYLQTYPNVRVLIYDISNAFGDKKMPNGELIKGYKKISADALLSGVIRRDGKMYKWVKGARRIVDINPEDFLRYAAEDFYDGCLVIDEATTLFNPNPSVEQTKFMTTHTNHRCDGLYIFHRLADVPKKLRNSFWNYILFATGDNIATDDPEKGVKDVESLGFSNAAEFYDKWRSVQTPEAPDKIIQKFTTYTKNKRSNQ